MTLFKRLLPSAGVVLSPPRLNFWMASLPVQENLQLSLLDIFDSHLMNDLSLKPDEFVARFVQ